MIDAFLNSVVLYKDSAVIIFNYKYGSRTVSQLTYIIIRTWKVRGSHVEKIRTIQTAQICLFFILINLYLVLYLIVSDIIAHSLKKLWAFYVLAFKAVFGVQGKNVDLLVTSRYNTIKLLFTGGFHESL